MYILIFPSGKYIDFSCKQLAKTYKKLYGGRLVYQRNLKF